MKVVAEKDWIKGHYRTAAVIDVTAADIEAKFGVKFDEYDGDGLGLIKGQVFELADGRQFMLEQYTQAPQPWDKKLSVQLTQRPYDVQPMLIDVLKGLNIQSGKLTWVNDDDVNMDIVKSHLPKAGLFGGPRP